MKYEGTTQEIMKDEDAKRTAVWLCSLSDVATSCMHTCAPVPPHFPLSLLAQAVLSLLHSRASSYT